MSSFLKKGGAWRNSEDEILKAAVMKYGRNQSSRVASLLQKKSAKQCKARWTEWLDPSFKKTVWSVEEDEKLLHLAKLMPSQWTTIAPMVGGRTSTQCIERFEFLLDQGQIKQGDGSSNDLRKLKTGELVPNPESKPDLLDVKNMDQDELEMLAETRARLVNTQGKKAKRKAHEKHMEEATRLAAQQKRYDLRAAEMNYNVAIPFEKKPTARFYDILEQSNPTVDSISNSGQPNLLNKRNNKKLESKLDNENTFQTRKEKLPSSTMTEKLLKKGDKLELPKPQISDKEIRKVVKLRKIFEISPFQAASEI